jgi:glycosyltransferase involved in cell wall biosynthesis
MTKLPKLLVLGSSLPGARHGGGVVQMEVLRHYPRDRFVCFSVGPEETGKNDFGGFPESLKGVPCRTASLVPRLRLRGYRFYFPPLQALSLRLLAPWRLRQAVAFGKQHGAELVWAELQGNCLAIAQKVAEALGVPLVGTIWDDPESWLAEEGYDRFSRRLLHRRFRESLLAARHLSTAGEAMQAAYQKEYGVRSVILRHGFSVPVVPDNIRQADDSVVIGFVGNAYGRYAWTAFLGALSSLNASGTLPRIKLRVFGPSFPYRNGQVEIELRGWQPAEVMLREIAATDFCYLQHWFESGKRRHAELSFPNKFETYLAATRPVLFHGPVYSGITQTVSQYGVGVCVHTLDQGEIAVAVKRLVLDQPLRERFSQASLAAFQTEFNASQMMKNFASLIGLDPGEFGRGLDFAHPGV